ncbi:MAG: thioredoxin family protein [Sulfuricella sp.]|jgi:thioredoxin-related protein|nr:thioredoxin family protein [Sulfuricella sp.]
MARFLLGLILCLGAFAVQAESRDVQQYFFDQHLGDFKAELDTAKKGGKQGILLMFEMEECPFCHRMKQTILNQSEVQDYYRKHFLIFSVDTEGANALTDFSGKETTEKKFALEQRVRATPTFVFYDLSGQPLTRFTGAAKDAKEFMALGRYVVEGAYKTLPFAKYRQQQAGQ